MKRITVWAFALVFTSLTACGDPSPDATGENLQSAPPTGVEIDKQAQPADNTPDISPGTRDILDPADYPFKIWTGDLDIMEERRVIRVLTVYSIGRYYLEDGQPKGLIVEISKRFEKFINQQLKRKKIKVYVAIIPVARDQLIPALLEGRGDIINASLSITPEREEQLDFSMPISKPISEILVTGPSAPELHSIEDLSGQPVYVRHSSSYRESLEQLNQKFLEAGQEPVQIEPVSELLEDDDLIEMVNAGLLPWAIIDDYRMQLWRDVFTELVPRKDIVLRAGGQLAWAFRKESPLLKAVINEFVSINREGTLIGNVLKKRYITDFDWAANALSDEEYKRFEQLEEIFRKYGELYEIDYLLAAAQGFQESRLLQSARSKAGAVGIMQMLPATASDPNVAIPNIHETEKNIQAGMKYLNFLRSRYFADAELDRLNQTLLALAAYNAGPSRMINLRNKAKKLGYDPNTWFDNVEIVAASDIGPETVQYVANIYKYYLAYRYSLEQMARRSQVRERAGIE